MGIVHKAKSANWKHYFWLIPLLIILSPIIIIATVYYFFQHKKRKREAKEYLANNQGKCYFFYSNRKGWGDFIMNNVIPVLPEDTLVFNIHYDKNNPVTIINRIADNCKIPYEEVKQPFFIKLSSPTPKTLSLRKDFNIIKKTAKRDSLIQADIRSKLDKLIGD